MARSPRTTPARKLVVLLLGALVALCISAMPRAANAATVETCDRDAFASMIPMAELAAMLNLGAALPGGDLVGFCDARGATGIAPLPALPLDDSVLDGADGRPEAWSHAGVNADGRRDAPSHHAADGGSVDPAAAAFVSFPTLPALGDATVLTFGHARTELPDGHGRGLDHPPRT